MKKKINGKIEDIPSKQMFFLGIDATEKYIEESIILEIRKEI